MVFLDPVVHHFLKDTPQMHQLLPPWDLNLVLTKLMAPPFEALVAY